MKKILTVVALISTFALSGCGDNEDVAKVKAEVLKENTAITLGDAFKTRTDCDAGTWDSTIDRRGAHSVTYTCKLNKEIVGGINAQFKKHVTESMVKSINTNNLIIERADNYLKTKAKTPAQIEGGKKILNEAVSKHTALVNEAKRLLSGRELKDASVEVTWTIDKLRGVVPTGAVITYEGNWSTKPTLVEVNAAQMVSAAYGDWDQNAVPLSYIQGMVMAIN